MQTDRKMIPAIKKFKRDYETDMKVHYCLGEYICAVGVLKRTFFSVSIKMSSFKDIVNMFERSSVMFLTPVPLCPLDFSYTEFCSPPTPQINLFFLHVHSFCSALNHFFCGPSRILYLLFISLCLICSTSPPLRFKFFVVLYSVKNRPATR